MSTKIVQSAAPNDRAVAAMEHNAKNPFLLLPGEVLNNIYDHVLTATVIDVVEGNGDFNFYLPPDDSPLPLRRYHYNTSSPTTTATEPTTALATTTATNPPRIHLNELQFVCRKLHRETRPLAPHPSVLRFSNPATAKYSCVRFFQAFDPSHLTSLTRIIIRKDDSNAAHGADAFFALCRTLDPAVYISFLRQRMGRPTPWSWSKFEQFRWFDADGHGDILEVQRGDLWVLCF